MVERPVKKSERQAKDTNSDNESVQPSGQRSSTPPARKEKDRDRDRGKGKRGDKKDEPRVAANPALMRGPKPVQAVAAAPEPEVIEEVVAEEAIAEEVVAEEAVAEETVAEETVAAAEPAPEIPATEAPVAEEPAAEAAPEAPPAE